MARDGASTASCTGPGGGLPTGASSRSIGSSPFLIMGSALPPAVTVAMYGWRRESLIGLVKSMAGRGGAICERRWVLAMVRTSCVL